MLKKIFLSLTLICAVLLPAVSFAASDTRPVRVLLKQDHPAIKLSIRGPYEIHSQVTGKRIGMSRYLKTQVVRPGDGQITIGKQTWATPHMRITSTGRAYIRINGRKYRGQIDLISDGPGKLWVLNIVDIEDYLPGVLGWEVGSLWPMEALKAQAIVSRTMVAHRMWIRRDKRYDVTATTSTQVYGGRTSEKWKSRKACQKTVGEVLAFDKQLLSATFHASCGGHTEDATELWNTKGDPVPLQGNPDPYCKNLKHYKWTTRVLSDEFVDRLDAKKQPYLGQLQAIEILDRNVSGRARSVRVQGSLETLEYSGKEFRKLLGANWLKSLNFQVDVDSRRVVFSGLGWGHGVGMCQWGAYGQGKRGRKAQSILEFYFPGSYVRQLKGLPGFNK